MKKLLILFMAIGLVTFSCNNDKGKGAADDRNSENRDKDRDKDDYSNRDKDDDRNKDRDEDEDDNSSGGRWSSSDRSQWMRVCRDPLVESMGQSKATDYCECILEKIEKKYSSFQKMNTQGTETEGEELGLECVRELGIGNN